MVGEKGEVFVNFGIEITNATELVGILVSRIEAREKTDLIVSKPRGFVHGMRIQATKFQVAFGAGDKESQMLSPSVQTSKIEIPTIQDINRAGFENPFVENMDLVNGSLGHSDKSGDISVPIE